MNGDEAVADIFRILGLVNLSQSEIVAGIKLNALVFVGKPYRNTEINTLANVGLRYRPPIKTQIVFS